MTKLRRFRFRPGRLRFYTKDAHFKGDQIVIPPGTWNLSHFDFNDDLSSIKITNIRSDGSTGSGHLPLGSALIGLPERASSQILKFAPVFDFDTDGCYAAAAISKSGRRNPGLDPDTGVTKFGRNKDALANANTYARRFTAQSGNDRYDFIIYALYFPKDVASGTITKWNHRHDWEYIGIWLKNNALEAAHYSAHSDEGERKQKNDLPFYSGSKVKAVYHKESADPTKFGDRGLKSLIPVRTHSMRFAGKDEHKAENALGKWFTPKVVEWQYLNHKDRESLESSWGHANPPFIDGNWRDEIKKYAPSGWPTSTNWASSLEGTYQLKNRAHGRVLDADVTKGPGNAKLQLWDARSGQEIKSIPGHAATVYKVRFSADGKWLASASRDKTIRLLDAMSGADVDVYEDFAGTRDGFAFSSDGTRLAMACRDGAVRVRETMSGNELALLMGHEEPVTSVAFNPNGKVLATAGEASGIRLWNLETGKTIAVLKGHNANVNCLSFSPDGMRLASASSDGALKIWNTRTHDEFASISGDGQRVLRVAFSPDNRRLATACGNVIRLYTAQTGQEILALKGHSEAVLDIGFNPTGTRLASASYDKTVKLWNVAAGLEVLTFGLQDERGYSVGFSHDGTRLVSAGTDRALKLWTARPDEETSHLINLPEFGHAEKVSGVVFGVDGTRIYSESRSEKRVWNVATREPIPNAEWQPPAGQTPLSPDGRWFVTAESNNVILVDLKYRTVPHERAYRVSKASFTPAWHLSRAAAAKGKSRWYAATFHNAWLLGNDPVNTRLRSSLHSSYQQLAAQFAESDQTGISTRLKDQSGNHHGAFLGLAGIRTIPSLVQDSLPGADGPDENVAPNHALVFDGSNFVRLGNPPFYKASLTVEGWIKPYLAAGERGSVFTVRTDGSENAGTALGAEVTESGQFRVILRNPPSHSGGLDITSERHVADGKWHHFATVKGADDKLRLYLDGQLEAVSEHALDDFDSMTCEVILGANTTRHPRYFNGLMDEFRFWNSARNSEEINRNIHGRIDAIHNGLIAHYTFERDDDALVLDTYLAPVVRKSLKLLRDAN